MNTPTWQETGFFILLLILLLKSNFIKKMKSIKANFEKTSKKYPNHSSFICFGRTVMGKKYLPSVIRKNFNVLVDPDDYDPKDKFELFKHFDGLTNMPEEAELVGKYRL